MGRGPRLIIHRRDIRLIASTGDTLKPTMNREIRILPPEKANQAWAWLIDEAGQVVVSATERAPTVHDAVARLIDAHQRHAKSATFAAVAHGIRFVDDGQTGYGSPLFIEKNGARKGVAYFYPSAQRQDARDALRNLNVDLQDEKKGGLYVMLRDNMSDDETAELLKVGRTFCFSNRAPIGYNASLRPMTVSGVLATSPKPDFARPSSAHPSDTDVTNAVRFLQAGNTEALVTPAQLIGALECLPLAKAWALDWRDHLVRVILPNLNLR